MQPAHRVTSQCFSLRSAWHYIVLSLYSAVTLLSLYSAVTSCKAQQAQLCFGFPQISYIQSFRATWLIAGSTDCWVIIFLIGLYISLTVTNVKSFKIKKTGEKGHQLWPIYGLYTAYSRPTSGH